MIIGEIEKNALERIRVTLAEFKGHRFIDLRIFFEDKGEWKPTKKGITVNKDSINSLIKLLTKGKKRL